MGSETNNSAAASIRLSVRSILAYFLYIAVGIGVGFLLQLFVIRQFGSSIATQFGSVILYSAAIFAHFRFTSSVPEWPSMETASLARAVAWGLPMAVVAYVVASTIGHALLHDYQGIDDSMHLSPEDGFRRALKYVDGPVALTIIAVDACILAPIAEEILFRSGVYRIMKGRLSGSAAASVSAAVFALIHGSFVAVVPLFVLGYLCCWIYDKTNDIRGPIILHAGYNALVFLPFWVRVA